VIWKLFEVFLGGNTAQHQDGINAGMDTGDNISVHTVANDSGFFSIAPKYFSAMTHHERVGFAQKIGFYPGGQFNWSY
jgi:hypothetical protein